ncbi:MAG: electron transporter RnfD [Bacteroidales bacterium]|nr:electron transporter RnfD [Bacteroidales bacterium]MCF8390169.1 electron transporter RnfD [Bacteroidales bacterium]
MKNVYLAFILLLFFSFSCKKDGEYIPFNHPNIQYTGRVNLDSDSSAIVYWPGTSIKINFEGREVKALIKDENGRNYYNIILDNDSIILFHPKAEKQWYSLISGIPDGKHQLEVFKRTEWDRGETHFYGFESEKGGRFLEPTPLSDRTIEFFGNSITAGYAIEDTIGDSSDSIFTNNYLAYGALTARHFDANYYCTAKGGIGITVSWFPMIMKEMYYRLDPEDSASLWDFTRANPDIVVINLFQNDSWLVNIPNYPEFISRFGTQKPSEEYIIQEYFNFLNKIRTVYPGASIICALGSMDATKADSPWPRYIEKAVELTKDSSIYTCFFPYENIKGHPEVEDHRKMADILIGFIEENGLWE